MKKMRNLLAVVMIGSVLFVSCGGDDTTNPVVTLKGTSDTTIVLNSPWTDPGATAEDDEDGVITDIQVTGTVNKDLTGTYVITYSATDAAGNKGTTTRTVRVRNTADGWAGNYSVIDEVDGNQYTYTDIITYSQTENKYVWVTKFAYNINGVVKFKFETPENLPTDVTLPQQTVSYSQENTTTSYTFSGSGEGTTEGSFYIDYTEKRSDAVIIIVDDDDIIRTGNNDRPPINIKYGKETYTKQ